MHRTRLLLATTTTTTTTSTGPIAVALRSPRPLCSCRTFSIASRPAAYPTAAARCSPQPPAFTTLTASRIISRTMSSSTPPPPSPPEKILFGPFDVSTQVFYITQYSFALVNLKPLLPGHVLVCPKRPHRRLTDLDSAELVDLFAAVQVVQRMLATHYFGAGEGEADEVHKGSFNLAIQDGPEAGQTVPHVHVHVLPRIRGATAKDVTTEADALYEKMADEPGNVGGAQWDAAVDADAKDEEKGQFGSRPRPGGRFPRIEDCEREARTMEAMEAEAAEFRQALSKLSNK